MDWKNNIITQTDCSALAQPFVAYANEDFLVTLANKGLYKRALKDLETTGRIELIGSTQLQVVLDDVTVTLHESVAQSTCTCPSKTICKHVLMAVLVATEYVLNSLSKDCLNNPPPAPSKGGHPAGPEVGHPSSHAVGIETRLRHLAGHAASYPPLEGAGGGCLIQNLNKEPWKELKTVDIPTLRKQAGKKLFEDVLRLIQDGWVAEFTEGDMLQAVINTENITVYFPAQDSINRAVCKCGAQGLCKHKLIAILSYLSNQGLLNQESDADSGLSLITPEIDSLLHSADDFIIDIFDKGIIFCGENEVETSIQYSIRMETAGIGNLARMFRSLSTDLENMLNKHVGFNQISTFAILSRLHNTMRLILENTNNTQMLGQLIESTRSDYYTTPVGHFTGLGAYPWQTRSGYFGITAYFYYHEKQALCTYSVSLAGYYEQTEDLANMDNMKRQYMKNEHWMNTLSLATLSQSTFVLRNFKLNRQNRLSSSVQTQCELTDQVNREVLQELLSTTSCFFLLEETEAHYDYFRKREADWLVILPFQCIEQTYFNPTEQKLYISIKQNEEAEVITAAVEYTPLYAQPIKYFEKLGRYPGRNSSYMVLLRRPNGLMPISIIGDSVSNSFFEQ